MADQPHQNRERAIITPGDREFLKDPPDDMEQRQEATKRHRIRQRVCNGLRDASILFQHLNDEERTKIFDELWSEPGGPDHIAQLLGFIYAGTAHGERVPGFEELLNSGVRQAEQQIAPEILWDRRDVDVTFEFDVDTYHPINRNFEAARGKIERGDWAELSDEEARAFLWAYSQTDGFDADAPIDHVRQLRDQMAEEQEQ